MGSEASGGIWGETWIDVWATTLGSNGRDVFSRRNLGCSWSETQSPMPWIPFPGFPAGQCWKVIKRWRKAKLNPIFRIIRWSLQCGYSLLYSPPMLWLHCIKMAVPLGGSLPTSTYAKNWGPNPTTRILSRIPHPPHGKSKSPSSGSCGSSCGNTVGERKPRREEKKNGCGTVAVQRKGWTRSDADSPQSIGVQGNREANSPGSWNP